MNRTHERGNWEEGKKGRGTFLLRAYMMRVALIETTTNQRRQLRARPLFVRIFQC